MSIIQTSLKPVALVIVCLLIIACSRSLNSTEASQSSEENIAVQDLQQLVLSVYKSPTCGCCNKWISHLHEHQVKTTTHHPDDMLGIKAQYGIQANYQSCHTAVSQDDYIFEGHVPVKFIKRFLAEKPQNAIGLSVPGMPLGSPGMEVGDQFREYNVLLLHKDGSSSVYATIKNASEQY